MLHGLNGGCVFGTDFQSCDHLKDIKSTVPVGHSSQAAYV